MTSGRIRALLCDVQRDISDTAFLVNESRARRADLSLDWFARSWVPPERMDAVDALWRRYVEAVYPHDALELGLRHRHYLGWIGQYRDAHPAGSLINLGAGLVSYPYLLDGGLRWIEVDLRPMIDFKHERAKTLYRDGNLPEKPVSRLAADLASVAGQRRLFEALAPVFESGPTCVLMEGLTYYLPESAYEALMRQLTARQMSSSLLAFDYWTPDAVEHPVFRRQAAFFGNEMSLDVQAYRFVTHEAAARNGYVLRHQGGVREKARDLGFEEPIPAERELLPEYSVVLERR